MWNPIWFFVSAVYPTVSLAGVFGFYLLLESRARRAGRPQGAREENMKKIFNYILPAWFLQSVLMIIWAIFKDGFVHALPGICILLLIALMIAISLSRQEWLQTIENMRVMTGISSNDYFLGSPGFLLLAWFATLLLFLALRYDLI